MSTLMGAMLAAALLAQLDGRTIEAKIVDEQGKPVAGALVVFYAPPRPSAQVNPVEVRAETDAQGQFVLRFPPLRGQGVGVGHVWVYKTGSAIMAAAESWPMPPVLVLRRDVAAALFEPIRERMEHADQVELARWGGEFWGWSMFDPRAAVARLERVPVTTALENRGDSARTAVARSLGTTHDQLAREALMRWLADRGN